MVLDVSLRELVAKRHALKRLCIETSSEKKLLDTARAGMSLGIIILNDSLVKCMRLMFTPLETQRHKKYQSSPEKIPTSEALVTSCNRPDLN